jgi:uncharacterized phage-like protein YoqJ
MIINSKLKKQRLRRIKSMKIDIKWIIGILGTILMGLSTWVLVSVVDLKEKTSGIQAELFIINQQFGRVYNHMNEMMMKK